MSATGTPKASRSPVSVTRLSGWRHVLATHEDAGHVGILLDDRGEVPPHHPGSRQAAVLGSPIELSSM